MIAEYRKDIVCKIPTDWSDYWIVMLKNLDSWIEGLLDYWIENDALLDYWAGRLLNYSFEGLL